MSWSRLVLSLAIASTCPGCTGEAGRGGGSGQLPLAPRAAAGSPLFVHFPDLDHHIVEVDAESGKARRTFYPDQWAPVDFVLDFAVDRDHLYAVGGRRQTGTRSELLIADLKQAKGRIDRIPLSPAPQSLHWTCSGALLVAHGTGPSGPAGRLSVVDLSRRAVARTIPLAGGCTSVASAGNRALALERTLREEPGGGEVAVTASLAELDLDRGKVLRRRPLPPGARQVIVGPSGLIYVSHASGLGTMATDGTISVLAPRGLRLLRRLRMGMVVRGMAATPKHLVLNMLSDNGDPWVEVQGPDNTTLEDFKLGELIGSELVVLGDRQVLVPLRRGSSVFRASLQRLQRMARLKIGGGHDKEDRPGLVRTRMGCRAR